MQRTLTRYILLYCGPVLLEPASTAGDPAAQTEGYSLEAQQERLREYADYKNLLILSSGFSLKNKAFSQIDISV